MKLSSKSQKKIQSIGKVFLHNQGVKLRELADLLIYVKVHSRVNTIPYASLEFSVPYSDNNDIAKIEDLSHCQLGSEIKIDVDGGEGIKTVFVGVIVSKDLNIENNYANLSMTLKHNVIKLDNTMRSQVFTGKTDNEIIKLLCSFSGVKLENNVKMDIQHEQRIQFRCSDWQMLRYCLDVNSAWLIAEPSAVRIIQPELSDSPNHFIDSQGDLLIEKAKWQLSSLDQPHGLQLIAWDIDSQSLVSVIGQDRKLVSGSFITEGNRLLSETPWEIGFGISPPVDVLRNYANALLLSFKLSSVCGELSVPGSMRYELGQTLNLSGFGHDFDGSGIITALVHTITPSKWTTSITMGEHTRAKTMSSLPRINGLQPGIVASYDNDPKGIYRIRVNLPILDSDNNKNQIWARFAMPYASNGRSFICYPEPGDEVVVGFYEDNPSYAVIVGTVHNPKKPPAVIPGQDNGMKGWRTKDAQLQMNTQKNSIHLQVEDKTTFTMQRSQEIKIESDNGIVIDGGKVVTIKGRKIDLTK